MLLLFAFITAIGASQENGLDEDFENILYSDDNGVGIWAIDNKTRESKKTKLFYYEYVNHKYKINPKYTIELRHYRSGNRDDETGH